MFTGGEKSEMSDYYERLGVQREASTEQIKKAFRERAFEYHPDRNPNNPAAEESFKKINEAYSILSDPAKKERYDAGGYNPDEFMRNPNAGSDPFAGNPFGGNPFYGNSNGQYTWTYTNTRPRQETSYTKRDAVEMLLRSIFSVVMGVLLFRFAAMFGIFGILICITAIGRGFMNSLRAIMLLVNSRK
jgi:molecular chaperone DnaJ